MLWFKPQDVAFWGQRYSSVFEFENSLQCYFTSLGSVMCDSVKNCDKLMAMDVGKQVQVNEWAHITVSGRMSSPYLFKGESYLTIETNTKGIVSEEDYLVLEKYTRALFQRGTEIAASRGLILVDTKYEFGKTKDGKIVLIDEIHTPDSSRYFYADGYQERQNKGEQQKQLSKEFVRQWLIANGFQGKDGQQIPEMTEEYVESVSERYIELFENIIGEKFAKADIKNINKRIEDNVLAFLNK